MHSGWLCLNIVADLDLPGQGLSSGIEAMDALHAKLSQLSQGHKARSQLGSDSYLRCRKWVNSKAGEGLLYYPL